MGPSCERDCVGFGIRGGLECCLCAVDLHETGAREVLTSAPKEREVFAMRAIIAMFLFAGLGLSSASASELLYGASGYPDHPEYTEGKRGLHSYYEPGPSGIWRVTGVPVTVSESTRIEEIWTVGAVSLGDLLSYDPYMLNVHGWNGNVSPEQMFGGYPFEGNILSTTNIEFGDNPVEFTSNFFGIQNYYFPWEFEPFVLEPGDYYISISVYINRGGFASSESSLDLGSALRRADNEPWTYWSDWPFYSTGTAAWDIYGEVVPEPSTLTLLALCSLLAKRRG